MGKIITGCWDCQYCGTTRISGDLRDCPNCGRPRDKDVKFYIGDPANYAEDPDKVSKDPDWLCPYCDSLNPASERVCQSCGAVRDQNTADYFENQRQRAEEKARVEAGTMQQKPQAAAPSARGKKPLIFLIIAAALIALVVFLVMPKKASLEIATLNWERTVEVEHYTEVEDSDWYLPEEAYNVTRTTEIYGYEQVFDHYETRSRQVAEQVFDGYDTSYSYRDLGNGHFEQVENRTPKYRTEYRTETYQEPIYRNEPIYKTRYHFLIMRWVTDHVEATAGENDEPYYASIEVSDTVREGARTEKYWLTDTEGKTYDISYDLWKNLEAGQKINAKVQYGTIISIE